MRSVIGWVGLSGEPSDVSLYPLPYLIAYSHGRDNIIHFHEPLNRASAPVPSATETSSALSSSITLISATAPYRTLFTPPRIIRSLPVNSLNFCGFDLVPIPTGFELDIPVVDDGLEEQDEKAEGDAERGRVDVDQGKAMRRWKSTQGLLAVPNLTDSETVRPYHQCRSLSLLTCF